MGNVWGVARSASPVQRLVRAPDATATAATRQFTSSQDQVEWTRLFYILLFAYGQPNPTQNSLWPSKSTLDLVPHGNPAPARKHPRRNVHAHQLLEEQLRRVRDVHLRNLGPVLARPALKLLPRQVPAPVSFVQRREEALTQWASSARKSRTRAPGTRPTPRTAAPSGMPPPHAQSCSRAPSLRTAVRRPAHVPRAAAW